MNQTTVNYSWMEANLPVYGDGVTHYYCQGPTFDPENMWDPGETVNVDSRDYGAAMGTAVKDLCDLVGGASAGDTIRIKSPDGFSKTFDYEDAYAPEPEQGKMIIAWYNPTFGGYVPAYDTGMRLLFFAETLNPDGKHVFGLWDMHETLAESRWHYYYDGTTLWPSSSGLSVQQVSDIMIYTDEPVPTPSVSPTASPSATLTVSPTKTLTVSPTARPSASPTATLGATETAIPAVTPTTTNTSTPTPSLTTTVEPETTPDTQLPGSVVINTSGGNASTTDGNIFVVFPPGAVEQDTVITISHMHGELGIGQTYFSITTTANGTHSTTLAANVTVCVRYTDADLQNVGGVPDLLKLAYYDEGSKKWVALDTTVDPAQRLACASTDHLSEWTFMKAATVSSIPVWVWPVTAAIVIVLISIALLIYIHISTMKKKTAKEET